MKVRIAGRVYEVTSLKKASALYCQKRDAGRGRGASMFRPGEIFTAKGEPVGTISYNGNVWGPEGWSPGAKPLLRVVEAM